MEVNKGWSSHDQADQEEFDEESINKGADQDLNRYLGNKGFLNFFSNKDPFKSFFDNFKTKDKIKSNYSWYINGVKVDPNKAIKDVYNIIDEFELTSEDILGPKLKPKAKKEELKPVTLPFSYFKIKPVWQIKQEGELKETKISLTLNLELLNRYLMKNKILLNEKNVKVNLLFQKTGANKKYTVLKINIYLPKLKLKILESIEIESLETSIKNILESKDYFHEKTLIARDSLELIVSPY